MRKMKLHAEALAVETFTLSPDWAGAVGTVNARQDAAADYPRTNDRLGTCLPGVCTCDGQTTCDYSGCIPCPNPVTAPAGIEGQNVPVVRV